MNANARRYLTLLGVILLAVSLGLAQGRMRMTPEQRTDTLAVKLSLTDSQKVSVLAVYKTADTVRQKSFQEHQGDRDAMRTAMESSRTQTDAKLKAILTEDQYKKYQTLMEQMRSGGGQRGN